MPAMTRGAGRRDPHAPKVWEASGHVAGFTDPLVDCRHCKNRFRADDPRIKGSRASPMPSARCAAARAP